jgi:putative phosphonate metabolism protein
MSHRFAIYFAPAATTALWSRAAAWLGRDASTDQKSLPAPAELDTEVLHHATKSARRYGFHATVKAPMILREGTTRQGLEAALADFAESHRAVSVGAVEIRSLDGFLAIVPRLQPQALTDFVGLCVAHFEPFRAPMAASDRDGRVGKGLTARQIELLDQFGYPYVMEQFRFHMTLTDRLPAPERDIMLEAAQNWFAPAMPDELVLDRLSLFEEPQAGAPFVRVADYPLSTQVAL